MSRAARYGLVVVLFALGGGRAAGQSVLSLHAPSDPTAEGFTIPRLGGGDPVAVGPSRLDVSAGDVLTIGLEERGEEASVSVWLNEAASASYASLTEAAVGTNLVVVVGGEAVALQPVAAAVTTGQLTIAGLTPEAAEMLTARLRGGSAPEESVSAPAPQASDPAPSNRPADSLPASPLPPPERLPIPARDLPGAPATPDAPASVRVAPEIRPAPEPRVGKSVEAAAGDAASAFTEAVRARDWRLVAAALHPEALSRLRPDALSTLRLDRGTVFIKGGERLDVPGVLGRPLRGDLAELSDMDLAVLYLAALDQLGVWGEAGPPRSVVGHVTEGDQIHVLLAAPARAAGGLSEVTVVTVRRDASGIWRPLLTHARGF